jgi:hypothetical protein
VAAEIPPRHQGKNLSAVLLTTMANLGEYWEPNIWIIHG